MDSERKDTIEIEPRWGYHAIGEDYNLNCVIRNHTTEKYENLRLSFHETSYEKFSFAKINQLPSHDPEEDGLKVSIKVRVKNEVVISDLSPEFVLTLECTNPEKVLSTTKQIRPVVSISAPTFRRFCPPGEYEANKYNILFFGNAGSCKTSTINSFYTMLNYELEILRVGNISRGMNHCTKSIQRYNFERGGPTPLAEDYNFFITDCWGLDKDNYNSYVFLKLLNGELPQGWSMDYTFQIFRRAMEQKRQIMLNDIEKRKVHACIYFITYDDIEFIGQQGNQTKQFFSKIHSKIPNPIVVISYVDDHVDGFRENPLLLETEEMKKKKSELSEKIGVPEMNIFFGINYMKENKPVFGIDVRNFEILFTTLQVAEQNFVRFARKKGEKKKKREDDPFADLT